MFPNKILLVSCLFCVYIVIIDCATWEHQRRRSARTSNLERNSTRVSNIACDQQLSSSQLESFLASIEEKFDDRFAKILARLDKLDGQVVIVDDKLLTEQLRHSESITAKLNSLDTKITDLDNKVNQLISHKDKTSAESSELIESLLQLKLNERVTDFEIISQLKDSLENLDEKIGENSEKLESLRIAIDEQRSVNGNVSRADEILMQILRKERRVDHTNLRNEILSVVKARVRSGGGEDDTRRNAESLTDMVSSFENMKSTTAKKKNQTTSQPRGLTFPKVSNKPAKINTTFVSEAFGNKDIKVSKQRRIAFQFSHQIRDNWHGKLAKRKTIVNFHSNRFSFRV